MPSVYEALQRLDLELASARRENARLLKIIHGYGSSGAGGEMNLALSPAQQEIREAALRICARFDDAYWLRRDRDGHWFSTHASRSCDGNPRPSHGTRITPANRLC